MAKFDPDAIKSLAPAQKARLLEIAKADKALPWTAIDDDLLSLKLVGKMGGVLGEQLSSISRDGWTVINHLGRHR